MIHEVDEAIRALIRRDAVDGGDVEVAFDIPSSEWASKRNKPTVNVFLFDVREELDRRRVQPTRLHGEDGEVTGRTRPPRFFRLSYLITAWTQRPEDEHRLLSAVLHAFLRHEELPEDLLDGDREDRGSAVHLTIGTPPPAERSIGEIWNALGGEMKPSLELRVVAPFDLDAELPAGPPVTEQPRLRVGADEGPREDVGGRPARTGDGTAEPPAPPAEETVTAGDEDEPGRVLTVRTIDRR